MDGTYLRQGGVISEIQGDCPLLATELEKLTLLHWVAIVDACDRVGQNAYHIDDLNTELTKAGLWQP